MASLTETDVWEDGIYQLEQDDLVQGGADGIDNVQARQLANRTGYLKALVAALGTGKQDAAVTLAALASLVGSADKLAYFTGASSAALTSFTAFARTLVSAADAAAARALLGAAGKSDIDTALAALVNSSPATLDTLNELAAALGNDPNFATTVSSALSSRLRTLKTGAALPETNIGAIWHDDYNSLMTWQAFTANGAAYAGYASVLVGGLLIDTQPTPRPGYIRSGVTNLSRSAYAALRGWAMHNGIMVATGTWAAGTVAVKDNADGTTFTAFDVRGEFPRFFDDSRGIDAARAFGSWAPQSIQAHTHGINTWSISGVPTGYGGIASASGGSGGSYNDKTTNSTGTAETAPRNVALLATIKF